MLVATASAWAECYVIEDYVRELPFINRSGNENGTSEIINFLDGATISFNYRINEKAGGTHSLIVEGWDGSKWNQLLSKEVKNQTTDASFTGNVENYTQIKFTRKAYKGATSIDAGKKTIIIFCNSRNFHGYYSSFPRGITDYFAHFFSFVPLLAELQ